MLLRGFTKGWMLLAEGYRVMDSWAQKNTSGNGAIQCFSKSASYALADVFYEGFRLSLK